jgi:dTDP-4-dehydrorhamnose reductase
MKITVIGANGQLGSDVCRVFSEAGHEVQPLNHNTADVADLPALKAALADRRPEVVINTAAMHNLDACEANPLQSFGVNAVGAKNLADLSREMEFAICHISTDYVFDGAKTTPYLETDTPLPLNVYGNSKHAGESFIRTIAERYFIVRVSGIYGVNPCRAKGGDNFVNRMLKLAKTRDEVRVVDDEVLTPTSTVEIARQLEALCCTEHYGLYHATAQGACSWYAFTKKIYELTNTKTKLSIANPNEFPAKVPRPKYSVLENHNLKKIGLDIMDTWENGLRRYLQASGYAGQ